VLRIIFTSVLFHWAKHWNETEMKWNNLFDDRLKENKFFFQLCGQLYSGYLLMLFRKRVCDYLDRNEKTVSEKKMIKIQKHIYRAPLADNVLSINKAKWTMPQYGA